MSSEEFREDVRAAIRRHGADLDADELRSVADDLMETADDWEGIHV